MKIVSHQMKMALHSFAARVLHRQHRGQVEPFGTVCFSLGDLCDPFAALRFMGFTPVITAEAPTTAEIAEKTFEASKIRPLPWVLLPVFVQSS